MGMLRLLASLLFLYPAAFGNVKKHKRGQGLLPGLQNPAPPQTGQPVGPMTKPLGKKRPIESDPSGDRRKSDETPCVAPVALDKLFSLPLVRQPAVAEPGVFYLKPVASRLQVHWQKQRGEVPTALTHVPSGVHYFSAAPNGSALLVLAEDANRTLAFSLAPDQPFKQATIGETVLSAAWSADSKWIAFTTRGSSGKEGALYRLETTDPKPTLLTPLRGLFRVADVSLDTHSIALVPLDPADAPNYIWSTSPPSLRELKHFLGATFLAFGANTHHWLATLGTEKLFVFPGAGEKPKVLVHDKNPLDTVAINSKRDRAILVYNDRGNSRFEARALTPNGEWERPLRAPTGSGVVEDRIAMLNTANKEAAPFFFIRASSTAPGELWFWDGLQEQQWTSASSPTGSAGCWRSPLTVASPSGPAFLFQPTTDKSSGALVVYLSAQPQATLRPRFSPVIQYFTQRGFRVFATGELKAPQALLPVIHWIKGNYSDTLFAFGADEGGKLLAAFNEEHPSELEHIASPPEESLATVRQAALLFERKLEQKKKKGR